MDHELDNAKTSALAVSSVRLKRGNNVGRNLNGLSRTILFTEKTSLAIIRIRDNSLVFAIHPNNIRGATIQANPTAIA